MVEYYNKRVKLRRLDIGDLVLRKVITVTRDSAQGKLGPTWEGPYRVVHYSKQGNYHLETLDGQKLSRPWNVEQLKKYHQLMQQINVFILEINKRIIQLMSLYKQV